jgi:arylsulfatase A-like enzyme
MLDTVRADHLGYYGYERDTSPNLDAFARDSLAFKYAFSAAPWTPPSVATILTGLYPASHGHMPPNSTEAARIGSKRLSPDLLTLPEMLRPLGYRTAAVSPNPWISALFGFDQGFDTFEYRHEAPARVLVSAGIALVEGFARRNEPFFLYLHFFDPHDPYTPPEPYEGIFPGPLSRTDFPYAKNMQRAMRRYDGEIRYLDDELGRFFSFLKQKGLYDRAIIVVVADHGEQFREHGRIHHGNELHNEEVHVPLLIRDRQSGRPAGAVEHVVSTVDLFPTILGQLGIPPPADQADGVSLFAADSVARRAGVISEIRRITDQRGFIGRDKRKAIFAIPLRAGEPPGARDKAWEAPQLVGVYEIGKDYAEQRPVEDATTQARLRAEMEAAFRKSSRPHRSDSLVPPDQMSDELLDQLKALGYLNGR